MAASAGGPGELALSCPGDLEVPPVLHFAPTPAAVLDKATPLPFTKDLALSNVPAYAGKAFRFRVLRPERLRIAVTSQVSGGSGRLFYSVCAQEPVCIHIREGFLTQGITLELQGPKDWAIFLATSQAISQGTLSLRIEAMPFVDITIEGFDVTLDLGLQPVTLDTAAQPLSQPFISGFDAEQAITLTALAQKSFIKGKVKLQGRQDLRGAFVEVGGLSLGLGTDGTFLVEAPLGTHQVTIRAPGYLFVTCSVEVLPAKTATLPEATLLAGDLNGNGQVDLLDLVLLTRNFGQAGPASWPGQITY